MALGKAMRNSVCLRRKSGYTIGAQHRKNA
ncbi:hypothetical protein SAMN05444421_10877 [Celeribacter marinus]|nr:hypothetical protein SAMN05444421_10877 [Celeribacter marinus]